jgi:hypothetical protein
MEDLKVLTIYRQILTLLSELTAVENPVYSERCQVYRDQIKEIPLGTRLTDPYPDIQSKFAIFWRLIFCRKKLTQSVNAKIQNDLGTNLGLFCYLAGALIPPESSAGEAFTRLTSLTRRMGYSFDFFPSPTTKGILSLVILEVASEYEYGQSSLENGFLKISPESQELIFSQFDFNEVVHYISA